MRKIVASILLVFLSLAAQSQCDTTGILLELQGTTNLQGLLLAKNKCFTTVTILSPLSLSGDTLSIDTTGFGGGGGGGSAIANNGISDNEDGGKIRLGNRYMGSPDAPFTMARKVNIDGRLFHIGDLSDSSLLVIDGATDRVGIHTDAPARTLHVNGEVRITDLTTDLPIDIVGADADGDLGRVSLGAGLSISGGILSLSTPIQYQLWRDDGLDLLVRPNANFVSTATVAMTLTDDAGVPNETEVTANVVDASITNAKLATMNTLTIKGNNTGGTAAPVDLTVSQVWTQLNMTGSNNRVAVFKGANTLGNDPGLEFDYTNDRLKVVATTPALGFGNAIVNVSNSGSFTGSFSALAMVGDATATLSSEFRNSNTGANAFTIFQIGQAGDSAGDAVLQLSITGVGGITNVIGTDNSDGNKLKLVTNAATPSASLNRGITITADATAYVGINKDDPAYELDVNGQGRAILWKNTSAPPTATVLGAGLGTGAVIDIIEGGNNGFYIKFTTGTLPQENGDLFTVTYANSFTTSSFPVFCQGNKATADEFNKFVKGTHGPGSFKMQANGTLTASTQYRLDFVVFGL